MKILLAHHLESIWNDAMKRYGTNIHAMCDKVAEYLAESAIDKLIITQFELSRYPQNDDCYAYLLEVIDEKGIILEWQEYGYGWELECFAFEDIDSAREELETSNVILDSYGTKIAKGKS